MRVVTRNKQGATNAIRPPLKQGYYLSLGGIERVDITDEEGNTNTPIGDMGFEEAVPGVSYSGGSDDPNDPFYTITTPAEEGEYTFVFTVPNDSIDIELVRGVGNTSPNLAVRYFDLRLPVGVRAMLKLTTAGMDDLRYDSNGDGTFDTVVAPNVRVAGTAAQDTTAPSVSLKYSKRSGGGRMVTIDATDTETGVKTIYYRVGETGNFKIYTEPFRVLNTFDQVVEAFADDNVGNRSSPIRIVIPRLG